MPEFAARIITWQKLHGRHDLPWQTKLNQPSDPYAIWVSEIMLQQTQVAAVIGYYAKFMQRFPDIASLAQATQEEVLQYWSGLGYYSRARNLHLAATTVMDTHVGIFPSDFSSIQSLPGIGRSTAAAIAAFAFNQRHTILDGNVKRVLARHFLIEGWPSAPAIEKKLWALAESLLPAQEIQAYTQGLMDLGATLCTRSKPKCEACPLNTTCIAFAQQRVNDLPTPKPRKIIPQKNTTMLILRCGDEVMLEKRPASGIWGGLWSFPEMNALHQIEGRQVENEVQKRFGCDVLSNQTLPKLTHTFTHFKLHIQPHLLDTLQNHASKDNAHLWLNIEEAMGAAIPTAVRKILSSLQS